MITKIVLTYFVITIVIAPILCSIGNFLQENYWGGVGGVIGAILLDIGVIALIIDFIIVIFVIIGGTINMIWE